MSYCRGLIKRDFPHSVARLTGAYSLTMGAAAALGSAMVVPLALNGFGWQGALFMLMCFPLLALFYGCHSGEANNMQI